MMTRDVDTPAYAAGCASAPPPLHVTPDDAGKAWYPVHPMNLRPQPPGPEMVRAPIVAPFGDDPTDPAAQTVKRIHTGGMIARFNIGPRGERR